MSTASQSPLLSALDYIFVKLNEDGTVSVSGDPYTVISSGDPSSQINTERQYSIWVDAMERQSKKQNGDFFPDLESVSHKLVAESGKWLATAKSKDGKPGLLANLTLTYPQGTARFTTTPANRLTFDLIWKLRAMQEQLAVNMATEQKALNEMRSMLYSPEEKSRALEALRELHPLAEALCEPLLQTAFIKTQLLALATAHAAVKPINDFVTDLYQSLDEGTVPDQWREKVFPEFWVSTIPKYLAAPETIDVKRWGETTLIKGAADAHSLHAQAQRKPLASLRSIFDSNLRPGVTDTTDPTALLHLRSLSTAAQVLDALTDWENFRIQAHRRAREEADSLSVLEFAKELVARTMPENEAATAAEDLSARSDKFREIFDGHRRFLEDWQAEKTDDVESSDKAHQGEASSETGSL